MIPWPVIILAFVPLVVPFLSALVWQSMKTRRKKISKEYPFSGHVFERKPFSSYEQGYQGQTPAQSVKPFPLTPKHLAEPKQDAPNALYEQLLYEQLQTHSSKRDPLLPL